jgi:alkylation response protein AidB-like acyl-CoA dehydrogenase
MASPYGLGAQMWSVQMPLLIFGSDALKDEFLPCLVKGDPIGALAVTEPTADSEPVQSQGYGRARLAPITAAKLYA